MMLLQEEEEEDWRTLCTQIDSLYTVCDTNYINR